MPSFLFDKSLSNLVLFPILRQRWWLTFNTLSMSKVEKIGESLPNVVSKKRKISAEKSFVIVNSLIALRRCSSFSFYKHDDSGILFDFFERRSSLFHKEQQYKFVVAILNISVITLHIFIIGLFQRVYNNSGIVTK